MLAEWGQNILSWKVTTKCREELQARDNHKASFPRNNRLLQCRYNITSRSDHPSTLATCPRSIQIFPQSLTSYGYNTWCWHFSGSVGSVTDQGGRDRFNRWVRCGGGAQGFLLNMEPSSVLLCNKSILALLQGCLKVKLGYRSHDVISFAYPLFLIPFPKTCSALWLQAVLERTQHPA